MQRITNVQAIVKAEVEWQRQGFTKLQIADLKDLLIYEQEELDKRVAGIQKLKDEIEARKEALEQNE